ncbi:MAG TPA: class I SAM-dependent methyltransferase [Fimbriimonadales bacterium]|nr:class I SAM-dependent methyltransferase [Fimbriimonadales bacterium]
MPRRSIDPSQAKTSFTRIAPYYDVLMESVPYEMWLSYLKLVWSFAEVSPREVLEVCCGTGRLCRMLAKEGYIVAGVDKSAEMIAQAKEIARREGLDIHYEVQDVAEMNLHKRFDAAFSFFDSLNNIIDYQQFMRGLARVRIHLESEKPFLFDLNTAYAFEKKMFDQQCLSQSAKVRYKWKSRWDPNTRLCEITMRFWIGDEHFEEIHVQRAYSIEEIYDAMDAAGFHSISIFDAYTLNPPKKTSDRIHVLGFA